MYRLSIAIFLVALLNGCSSQSVSLQYYLLHTPNDSVSVSLPPDAQPLLIRLTNLSVSDYLMQRGLAVQTAENALHISTQHIWAEPFEAGFKKKLTHALGPDYKLIYTNTKKDDEYMLDLSLLHLVATYQGDAVLDARYTLSSPTGSTVNKAFQVKLDLDSDGYGHAVSVYRQAIVLLADDIKTQLSAMQ
ncbi:PqiC family protein [Alteromonas sediminis]|uniref:PqiC family protein n=1 Tax=Alteromonas sediminis TaxID=2259342 RepID=UPI0014053F58|nr:ABC-type transport auxiliary lipoprotein family protein [Alteromonas sediminis]